MNTGSIINIAVIVLLLWFVYSRVRPAKGLKPLRSEDFRNMMESTDKRILIDVREPGEYKTGYINGAKQECGKSSDQKWFYRACSPTRWLKRLER